MFYFYWHRLSKYVFVFISERLLNEIMRFEHWKVQFYRKEKTGNLSYYADIAVFICITLFKMHIIIVHKRIRTNQIIRNYESPKIMTSYWIENSWIHLSHSYISEKKKKKRWKQKNFTVGNRFYFWFNLWL